MMVCARFRPASSKERAMSAARCINIPTAGDGVFVRAGDDKLHPFGFQRVWGEEAVQEEVYSVVGLPLVRSVLAGYNASLLAYGQTGSGKTHTMLGPPLERADGKRGESAFDIMGSERGMLPRMLSDVFTSLGALSMDDDVTVRTTVRFVEIYQEEVFDLLDTDPRRERLKVRQRVDGAFWVPSREIECSGLRDAFAALRLGLTMRAKASTAANAHSSRSHAIFELTVQVRRERARSTIVSTLQAADLAGSEDARHITLAPGEDAAARRAEGRLINRGLHTLGAVCASLARGSSFAPFRDSKLTQLLWTTLQGDARTALLVCCSPASSSVVETMSTLRFGERAACIVAKPRAHIEIDHAALRKRLTEELDRVRQTKETLLFLDRSVERLVAVAESILARRATDRDAIRDIFARYPVLYEMGAGAGDFGRFLPKPVLWRILEFAGTRSAARASGAGRGVRRVALDEELWKRLFNNEVRGRGVKTGNPTRLENLPPTYYPTPGPYSSPKYPLNSEGTEQNPAKSNWGPDGAPVWKPRNNETFRRATIRLLDKWLQHRRADAAKDLGIEPSNDLRLVRSKEK